VEAVRCAPTRPLRPCKRRARPHASLGRPPACSQRAGRAAWRVDRIGALQRGQLSFAAVGEARAASPRASRADAPVRAPRSWRPARCTARSWTLSTRAWCRCTRRVRKAVGDPRSLRRFPDALSTRPGRSTSRPRRSMTSSTTSRCFRPCSRS
jgi:hypothetical protein